MCLQMLICRYLKYLSKFLHYFKNCFSGIFNIHIVCGRFERVNRYQAVYGVINHPNNMNAH
jgi:hypothetical protein